MLLGLYYDFGFISQKNRQFLHWYEPKSTLFMTCVLNVVPTSLLKGVD